MVVFLLPIVLPFALAFFIPDLIRCMVISLSICENTDTICNMPIVIGSISFPVQSTIKPPTISLMCLSSTNSSISHNCFVKRDNLLTSVQEIVSPVLTVSRNCYNFSLSSWEPASYSQKILFSLLPIAISCLFCLPMPCLSSLVEALAYPYSNQFTSTTFLSTIKIINFFKNTPHIQKNVQDFK